MVYNLWLDLRQKAEKKPAPALIHHDMDVVQRVPRHQFTGLEVKSLPETSLQRIWYIQPGHVENRGTVGQAANQDSCSAATIGRRAIRRR